MRLLLTTAAIVAFSGVAVAQQAPAPLAPTPAAPEITPAPAPGGFAPPSSMVAPSTPSIGVPGVEIAAAESRAVGGFIADQLATEFLATDLIGKDVMTVADERLGTINDLLLGEDGMFEAAILGTGGFLGIGEKQVAVAFSELEIFWNGDDDRWDIRSGLTLQAIETAPEFVRWNPDEMGPVGAAPEPTPVTPVQPVSPAPAMAPAPMQ